MTATSPRVLIVDDEPTIRSTTRMCLEDAGYTVGQAANGADALEQIEHAAPDLVLLDLAMPVIDGMSVLAELRSVLRTTAKVMIVTAHGSVKSAVEAMRLGAVDFLEKPYTPETLRRRVADILDDRVSVDVGKEATNTTSSEIPDIDSAELATEAGYRKALTFLRRHLASGRLEAAESLETRISEVHPDRTASDPSFLNLVGVTCEARGFLLRARSFYTPALWIDGTHSYQPAVDNKWRVYDVLADARSDIDVSLGDAQELAEAFPEGVPPSPLPHLKSARLTGNWDQ